jgi:hypothetical protein
MCILVCVKLFVGDVERWSYVNNAHSLKELEDKLTAFKGELCSMLRNIFRRGELCLQA